MDIVKVIVVVSLSIYESWRRLVDGNDLLMNFTHDVVLISHCTQQYNYNYRYQAQITRATMIRNNSYYHNLYIDRKKLNNGSKILNVVN